MNESNHLQPSSEEKNLSRLGIITLALLMSISLGTLIYFFVISSP
jgi:hypothetical protein